VETRSPDTDKVLQELRVNDNLIELLARALARSYVAGAQSRKYFDQHLIRKGKEKR
jgi:hypothetical protein